MPLEDLKKKATELSIEFDENVSEDDLNTLVSQKEEELSSDLDYLRNKLKFFEEESKKAFNKRDIAMKDKKALSSKVQELEDKLKNAVDKEQLVKLQTEFEDLKKYKDEVERLKEEEELKKVDEVERTKIQFRKEMEKMQQQFNDIKTSLEKEKEEAISKEKDYQEMIKSLRGNKLESEIVIQATKYKAWSPNQIVALAKGFFTYDEQLNKYIHLVRDDKGKIVDEQSVEEFIKDYLGKEENENLVKGATTDSSFDTRTHQRADTTTKTNSKGKYKANDPQIIKEAEDKNLSPADWAEIKERMEVKQLKMREKK
uniref:Uncharacterized protein n=1 Tax=viral metagenome TaxID=1070528 RepID=A0A6M3K0F9_9ZZZZ